MDTVAHDKSDIEKTSLPNSIIRTVSELHLCALAGNSPLSKKVINFMEVPKPGFWIVERTSLSGRRKEVGNSEAIVRFICFCQQEGGDVVYCTETIDGEFLSWGNCKFYCLLPYNFDWDSQSSLEKANLDWAKEAIIRHNLEEGLEPNERLFFSRTAVKCYNRFNRSRGLVDS